MPRAVHLLVRSPFGGHSEGDRITDPKAVAAILAGPHALHVLQTPAAPAPDEPTAKPAATRGSAKE